MIIRALDSDHDLLWGQGRGNYLSGNDAIGQNAQCRVWSWLGDCYFALRDGIDWLNLFGSRNKKIAIELAVNGTLIDSEGITEVTELSVSVNSARHISLSYSCDSIYTGVNNATNPQSEVSSDFLLDSDGNVITVSDGEGITT
jgi:hypothetical protein